MKKSILAISALSIVAASVLYSCKKEAPVAQTTEPAKKTSKAGFTNLEDFKKKMRLYVDDGSGLPGTYGCPKTGGNCHPDDIIINGNSSMSSLVQAIDQQSNIASFVQLHHEDLSQTIPASFLDGAINGSMNLSIRGDKDANYRCILFKDNSNAVILAVPVIK